MHYKLKQNSFIYRCIHMYVYVYEVVYLPSRLSLLCLFSPLMVCLFQGYAYACLFASNPHAIASPQNPHIVLSRFKVAQNFNFGLVALQPDRPIFPSVHDFLRGKSQAPTDWVVGSHVGLATYFVLLSFCHPLKEIAVFIFTNVFFSSFRKLDKKCKL